MTSDFAKYEALGNDYLIIDPTRTDLAVTGDDLRNLIRTIPDHPRPGIQFRDITTLLLDPAGLQATVEQLAAKAHVPIPGEGDTRQNRIQGLIDQRRVTPARIHRH